MSDREVMQQALEALEEATTYTSCPTWSPSMTKECETAAAALRTSLEQQAEPVAQRSDGMPISKMERELRRMLCIERHGRSAYMDDGEASFCGDKYCRSIDYMRESVDSIKQAWYDAGVKKLAGAQPEQQAEPVESSTRLPRWVVVFEEEAKKPLSVIGLKRDDINQAVRDYKLMQDLYESVANIRDAPPQRQWVELTSDEIADIAIQSGAYDEQLLTFARFTEAKLKEKNT